jgi:TolB-like protein
MGLVAELRRRNVFRVAIAYTLISWLILQVGDTLAPALRLPEWVNTAAAFFLILGFPLAVFFAWAYELTPEGIKLEKHLDRSQSISHVTGRKLDYLIIAILSFVLVFFAFDKFVVQPARDAKPAQPTADVQMDIPVEMSDRSIAVLAFTDMSPGGDQEYFSDGISDELLNVLAKIPGLRVAARTSSFQFKGENRDIVDIGEQLNTAFVLEGSVRKAGLQVRITAQLIDAKSGFHLWSASYDRELENIFDVQDEISAAIVDALKDHLGLQAVVPPRANAAASTDAHDAFLRGRHLLVQRTRTSIEGSVREFEKAITLDPDYAIAHAELAIANIFLGVYGGLAVTEAVARSAPHAERAKALDPTLAEAHAATGYAFRLQMNAQEAVRHFRRAVQINPNYALVYNAMGVVNNFLGEYDEAFAAFKTALQIDPLSSVAIANVASELTKRNRLAEADQDLQKLASISPRIHAVALGDRRSRSGQWANAVLGNLDALRISPETSSSRVNLAYGFAVLGLEEEALDIWKGALPFVLSQTGRHAEAVSAAKARSLEDPTAFVTRRNLGLVLAGAGDYTHARPILEEAWQRSGGRVTANGPFQIRAAAALIAIRRDAGEEAGIGELVAAIRDNVRRYREAGITAGNLDLNVEFDEGLADYLTGEDETGLRLIAKAVDDGYFIMQNQAYLYALYNDPGFASIRAGQDARQARERERLLAIVCTDNPYTAVWQPAEATCERFAAAGEN